VPPGDDNSCGYNHEPVLPAWMYGRLFLEVFTPNDLHKTPHTHFLTSRMNPQIPGWNPHTRHETTVSPPHLPE